jgi:hypothetical protein
VTAAGAGLAAVVAGLLLTLSGGRRTSRRGTRRAAA